MSDALVMLKAIEDSEKDKVYAWTVRPEREAPNFGDLSRQELGPRGMGMSRISNLVAVVRKENEPVPEGLSVTSARNAVRIYYRNGIDVLSIRIPLGAWHRTEMWTASTWVIDTEKK